MCRALKTGLHAYAYALVECIVDAIVLHVAARPRVRDRLHIYT